MYYPYHSTQLSFSSILSEKDYRFARVQELILDSNLYIENCKKKVINGLELEECDYGRETDSHCTILFGVVREEDYFVLREELKTFGPVSITLGEITKFIPSDNIDGKNFDVIKLDVFSDKLHELHNLIDDTCYNKNSYKEYHPHVTLAYVKPNSCDYLLGECNLSYSEFTFDKIDFSSNKGFSLEIPLVS